MPSPEETTGHIAPNGWTVMKSDGDHWYAARRDRLTDLEIKWGLHRTVDAETREGLLTAIALQEDLAAIVAKP